jgi:hypothetical protein
MFDLFQMYVAANALCCMTMHVCCKCIFQMFQLFQTYVVSVFYLDVAYVALATHVCCKCMFQIYVASVLSRYCIGCSGHTHMLQTYIVNV